jgi:HSP20 family molecular chaperone IbpA
LAANLFGMHIEQQGKGETKKMNKQTKELLTSVDVLNTLHGGVSEPFVSIIEGKASRDIRVRVPGIEKESLQTEIHNNELTLYYSIPVQSASKMIRMPRVIYSQPIPYFVEVKKIHASFDDRDLVIHMPFNGLYNGYHRKVTADN